MSRSPYTHAADFIRKSVGYDMNVSRSMASRVRQDIAEAIGMPDSELAEALSDAFKAGKDKTDE